MERQYLRRGWATRLKPPTSDVRLLDVRLRRMAAEKFAPDCACRHGGAVVESKYQPGNEPGERTWRSQ
jgi:hypothetical protein